jgi:hypothetical protein
MGFENEKALADWDWGEGLKGGLGERGVGDILRMKLGKGSRESNPLRINKNWIANPFVFPKH